MTTSTRAAVLRGHDQEYELSTLVLDELRPDEVLVRVVGVGMCHTDLLARDPGFSAMLGPVVLGHEGSGVVEKVGVGVRQINVGDHVVMSFDSCGGCASCLYGSPAYCTEFNLRNVSGRRVDGSPGASDGGGQEVASRWFGQSSFAEHAIATERNVVVVDPELPLELLGPLGCGLQTGAGVVLNEFQPAPGQSIVIFGVGAVGLAAVMAARAAGASEIVAVDLIQNRLDMALELGATRVVRGDADNVVDQVTGGGPGLDFSFDTTASSTAITAAIFCLSRPGRCVLVGVGPGELAIAPTELAGRTVSYSLEGSSVPKAFIPLLLQLWRDGRFPFDRLIRVYPLSDIGRAEADALAGVVVKPILMTAPQPEVV